MTPHDLSMIYDLSVGNPMFYEYCPPYVTRDSILSDMKAVPPNCTEEDKFYVGFFHENKLMAIMDLILGYPQEHMAYIGLFMVDKEAQGKGVGSEIIRECLDYLKSSHFSPVQLAFAKGNPQARAFWEKNGFMPTGAETNHGTYFSVSMEKTIS